MGFFVPVDDFCLLFAYGGGMFDPDAALPRPNRALIYLGACVIAGLRLAREKQVNVRVRPTGEAIEAFQSWPEPGHNLVAMLVQSSCRVYRIGERFEECHNRETEFRRR